jgi:hypothetical protein
VEDSGRLGAQVPLFAGIPCLVWETSHSTVSEFDTKSFDKLKAVAVDYERHAVKGNLYLAMQDPLPYSTNTLTVQFIITVRLSAFLLKLALDSMRAEAGAGVVLSDRRSRCLLASIEAAEKDPSVRKAMFGEFVY